MELFDLVDENDQVVGVTHKEEAHANKLLHRVVAVYVLNGAGEMYVQVHKKSGGLYDHSVGGHVSQGETYDEAARREAQEELGIDQPLTHISTFYSDEGTLGHWFGIYECVADPSWKFEPNEEVEQIILMPLQEVRTKIQQEPSLFTPGFINTMREYCRAKQLV